MQIIKLHKIAHNINIYLQIQYIRPGKTIDTVKHGGGSIVLAPFVTVYGWLPLGRILVVPYSLHFFGA